MKLEKVKSFSKISTLSAAILSVFIGCAVKVEIKSLPNRVYCTKEQRQVEACIKLYQPVCGYPEKKTYSNPCFACMDENVEYWVDGPCPE